MTAIKCVVTECIECIAMAIDFNVDVENVETIFLFICFPITEMNTHRNDFALNAIRLMSHCYRITDSDMEN